MASIFDYVNAKEIGAFITNSPSNNMPYLGATLFPNKRVLGLDLKWIKGSKGLPAAISPAAFDTKAPVRERIGFSAVETEMPFFREAMRIGEKDRQEINKLSTENNSAYLTPILQNIFGDAANLVEGARVQSERMRMQLLSSGTISVSDVRTSTAYNYNYGFDSSHKFDSETPWSDTANADPITDIRAAQDKIEADTGFRPTAAICSRKTFNYLLNNERIRRDMYPLNSVTNAPSFVTDAVVKQFFSTALGLSVAVYTKQYATIGTNGKPTGSNQYFPDDVFTLIPDGNLGSTCFGTTPEESDLMSGSDAQVVTVDNGIAVTTYKEPHPVNVVTVVSAICLPSFEQIDAVGILNVAASGS